MRVAEKDMTSTLLTRATEFLSVLHVALRDKILFENKILLLKTSLQTMGLSLVSY